MSRSHDDRSRSRDEQHCRAPGIRISLDVLRSAEHTRVLQAAWPAIAESFPCLQENEHLLVLVSGLVYAIQFVRLPEDWAFSISRLNEGEAVRLGRRLHGLRGRLPCWLDVTQLGIL